MRNCLNLPLICVILASTGGPLVAESSHSSDPPLTAAEARDLAAHATNAEDHLRLAAYYSANIKKLQADLAEEENLMQHWASVEGMADRNKIPNPYWSAKTLAQVYRAQLEKETRLAAEQRNMADSAQTPLATTK